MNGVIANQNAYNTIAYNLIVVVENVLNPFIDGITRFMIFILAHFM